MQPRRLTMTSANRPCSTDAEVDRPQDAISENGVARARVSQREPCIHDHVSDFLYAVLLLRKVLSEGGGGDFWQMLNAPRLREPEPRSSRITRCNLLIRS